MIRLNLLLLATILLSNCYAASAQSTAVKQPLNGQLIKNAHAKRKPAAAASKTSSTVNDKTAKPASSKTPRYHIDFTPANKSTNRFENFQSSMPDKAVKTYLHKIKAEPNSLAGIMPTPEGQAASTNQAPSTRNATSTAADTGSQPRVLSPSGVAIPQSSGTSSSFFK